MAKVVFEEVAKKFGKVEVIKPVNLEIKDKEFLVLVGPSGCGKSTMLRMIAGLEEITSGLIKIDDKIVNDLPPKDRDIAIVFQNYALYPHMTAYENMAFGLKIRKMSKSVIHQKVSEAARILEIEDLLDRKPKAMSGGQRQRIAIGRAIVRDPKVFLFDEPLSNLDAQLRGQMRLEIASLHKRLKTTIVYVTHDQVEAMTLGDRIVVLNKGIVQQVDTPQQLYKHPANIFVAGFIGSPKMNFLEGILVVEKEHCFFQDLDGVVRVPIENKTGLVNGHKITCGVRPEHIFSDPSKIKTTIKFSAKVTWVELLGHDGFAFFEIGGKQHSVRLYAEELSNPPFEKAFFLDIEKLHFFDSESGMAVD